MKRDIRKQSMSVALVMTVILALVVPMAADAQEIFPGPSTSLPDYIGAPAKAHPIANSAPQKDPFMAPHPFAWSHSDSWNSDTANIAGPLGRNPEVRSSTLEKARKYPADWLFACENVAFDSHGRPIVFCAGLQEASVIMLDPDTLEVLTYYSLTVREGTAGYPGDQQVPQPMWSIYAYVDNRDQINIISGNNSIHVLREAGSPSLPVFEKVAEYSLSGRVNGDTQRITGLIVDFEGRYWLNMGTSGTIYVLNPETYKDVEDLKSVTLGDGEVTRNGMAITKEGAYVVTTKKMYRVDAGADDQPYVVWSVPYDTIGKVRSGQYELGSGTSPTILGEGKYVAITDNAEQLNVVVYRTEAGLPLDQQVVCKVPVFDFPGGGKGANSNSLNGSHNSIIVQNTYGYLFDWDTVFEWGIGTLMSPSAPGIERIDIDPNGKGCTKVWVNTEVTSTLCPKLSTRTGLIYTQNRRYDAVNDLYAVYWVALDFRTGKVVWEKLAGTFARLGPARFDNFWAGAGIGPNGAMYGGQYAGITMIRDTR